MKPSNKKIKKIPVFLVVTSGISNINSFFVPHPVAGMLPEPAVSSADPR
jgi:hypothetical protein